MSMRIGYDDADSLLTYPHAPILSRYAVPIRMRHHKSTNRQAHVVSQDDVGLAVGSLSIFLCMGVRGRG